MAEVKSREEQEREYLEFHASKAGNLPSDFEVAGEVRMLMRDTLNHEVICVRARDKIAVLSVALRASEAEVERLRKAQKSFVEALDEAEKQGMLAKDYGQKGKASDAGFHATQVLYAIGRARTALTGEKK